MTQRIWLITGISSGFGRHLTEQLLDRGECVVGTVRRADPVRDLADEHPDNLRVEVLDVRDTPALRAVVDHTVADSATSTSSSPTPATACSAPPKSCPMSRSTRSSPPISMHPSSCFAQRCRTCGLPEAA